MSPRLHRPRRRTVGLVLLLIVALGAVGVGVYTAPQPLLPQATASLAATPAVAFSDANGRLEWSPSGASPSTGLIVYPGAKVSAAAYGPLAQTIASNGFLVVIVPMPLNFAILGIGAADGVIAAHPEIKSWAIGGHSLGGAMAAQYAAGSHPASLRGLALWASYSAADLAESGLRVVSVYGTLDAGADRITAAASRKLLPATTVYVVIEGGNHEQMGYYTGQPNDPPATISRDDQQAKVAEATLEMLARVQAQPDQFPPSAAPSTVPSQAPSGS
jgi:hypothetical protein